MNLLVIDTEYSSFYSPDEKKSGELLQVAAIPYINGIRSEKIFNEYCRPLTNIWNNHAEKVHGISRRKAEKHQHPQELANGLVEFVQSFNVMFQAIGHNCKNDKNYIERLIGKYLQVNEWHKTIRYKWKDTLDIAKSKKSLIPTKNHKLETLCKYFGIEIDAHDAASDAIATGELYLKMDTLIAANQGRTRQLGELSELDKRKKYLDMKYVSMGGDGCVFLTEYATSDREALRVILEEIWHIYAEA